MFFREKFGDVTDRIYTHDAALLPSIFQQAEAAGMALTSKSPTRRTVPLQEQQSRIGHNHLCI